MNKRRNIIIGVGAAFGLVSVLATSAASAQEAGYLAEFERPYGWDYGSEQRPFEASTRDLNGNRVIVNGLIEGGTTLGQGLNTNWGALGGSGMLGSGSAIGNQLNVVTNGSNNTIIIDSTQINNGDQTVVIGGSNSNGEH